MRVRLLLRRGPLVVAAVLFATPGVAMAAERHAAAAVSSNAAGKPKAAEAPERPSPEPERTNSVSPARTVAAPNETSARGSENAALVQRELVRLAAGRIEVAATIGFDVGMRYFRYNDHIGRKLRPYDLPGAPMLRFGLEAYPLASTDVPVLRDLGFRGRVSRAFAVDSNTPDGTKIATSWTRFGGEVRERFLLPGKVEVGAFGGVDSSDFSMKTKTPVEALLPSAHTLAFSFGLDARLQATSAFSFMLAGAYLVTDSPGEIYDQFRAPSVAGVDADVGLGLALAPGVEAQLGGRYTRYFATFHPQLGDANVAGGALDQQLQFGLGVRYAH